VQFKWNTDSSKEHQDTVLAVYHSHPDATSKTREGDVSLQWKQPGNREVLFQTHLVFPLDFVESDKITVFTYNLVRDPPVQLIKSLWSCFTCSCFSQRPKRKEWSARSSF